MPSLDGRRFIGHVLGEPLHGISKRGERGALLSPISARRVRHIGGIAIEPTLADDVAAIDKGVNFQVVVRLVRVGRSKGRCHFKFLSRALAAVTLFGSRV